MSKQDVIEVEGIVKEAHSGDVSIRPDQRQNYLEIQVILYN